MHESGARQAYRITAPSTPVDADGCAANLVRGTRAQEDSDCANLLRTREIKRWSFFGKQSRLRLVVGNSFSSCRIIYLLLHHWRQYPAGADRVARNRRARCLERDDLC